MGQKQVKSAKKHTVKEVLLSIQWTVHEGMLEILSPLSEPPQYVKIDIKEIMSKANGETNGKTE